MSILQAAHRLNEDLWFEAFQPLLLRIANTREGRDLLCIEHGFPTITRIYKNAIHHENGGKGIAEFRGGSKWANVIRHRWPQFQRTAKRFYELEQNRVRATMLVAPQFMFAAHATDTFTPDADPESTSIDGYLQYQESTSDWNTAHDASSASEVHTTETFVRALAGSTGGGNDQFRFYRAIVLFDASSVSGTVDSVKLTLTGDGDKGNAENDGNDYVGIVASAPASDDALVVGDYDSLGTTEFAPGIDIGTWNENSTNDFAFNSSGISHVQTALNGDGIVKLGVLEGHDILDDPMNTGGSENYVDFYSADNGSNEPTLEITYSAASGGLTQIERRPMRGAMRGAMRP